MPRQVSTLFGGNIKIIHYKLSFTWSKICMFKKEVYSSYIHRTCQFLIFSQYINNIYLRTRRYTFIYPFQLMYSSVLIKYKLFT
jgi:hypothetical protein